MVITYGDDLRLVGRWCVQDKMVDFMPTVIERECLGSP